MASHILRDRSEIDLTLRGSQLADRMKINVHEYFSLYFHTRINGDDYEDRLALIANEMKAFYANLADDELKKVQKFFSLYAEVHSLHLEYNRKTKKRQVGLNDDQPATIQ